MQLQRFLRAAEAKTASVLKVQALIPIAFSRPMLANHQTA